MTMQVKDAFILEKEVYSIIAASSQIPFHPTDYGITPMDCCTACWTGYWCDYGVTQQQIMLKSLYINSKDENYPEIHGVLPLENIKNYMGHHAYKNVNLPIDYTGKILAGKDFIDAFIWYPAWSYRVLKEFHFDHGELADIVDYSKEAQKVRMEIKKKENNKEKSEEISSWIPQIFPQELREKMWWNEIRIGI